MRFTFTQRAAPFCEVGFDDIRIEHTAGKWDTHAWDAAEATWSGIEPTWRDVSCEVWEANCEYGRAALTDRFVPGQATVLARNVSGWGDPHQHGMRPGRPIRFGVDHAIFGRVIVFRGFIDSVVPTYDPMTMPTVELQCIDTLGEVNRSALVPYPQDDQAVPPIVLPGEGETGDERVHHLLDRAAWPTLKRDIAPTATTLIAHEQGGQMADLLGQVADSIGGVVWGDLEGNVGLRARDWQMFDPTQPTDATIGNVEPTDVCPGQWQRPFDRASISTRVIMGRDAETAVQVDDIDGQMLYGIESFERVDLLTQIDAVIADLAERTLEARHHTTAPRVRAVTIDAAAGPEQLDLIAGVDVFKPSHYRCRLIEKDGRLVFDDRYMAVAVGHTITASAWTLEMNLDLAAPYEAAGASRWNDGRWDTATWTAALASLRADLERTNA